MCAQQTTNSGKAILRPEGISLKTTEKLFNRTMIVQKREVLSSQYIPRMLWMQHKIEAVQFLDVMVVVCSRFTTINQGIQEYTSVYCDLGCCNDATLLHTLIQRCPNALLTLASQQDTSLSREPDGDRRLPGYKKSSTFLKDAHRS